MDTALINQTGTTKVSLTPPESRSSTPATTPSSTPGLEAHEFVGAGASKASLLKALPPLSREFPKPEQDIDVEEALERQPGRWSIKGQMEANQRRAKQSITITTPAEDKEQKIRDFEAAKRDLLAYRESHAQKSFDKNR